MGCQLPFFFNRYAIHGFFQHSNIQLRLGWLNYVFSLPEFPKGYLGQLAAPFASRDISKPEGYVG